MKCIMCVRTCCQGPLDVDQRHFVRNTDESTQRHRRFRVVRVRGTNELDKKKLRIKIKNYLNYENQKFQTRNGPELLQQCHW